MLGGSVIEGVHRDEAQRLDGELVRMAGGQTVVRLAIGEGFVALGKGWQELGFSRFSDYVRERCARSGRWGEDTRTLAARLTSLPRVRERLLSGAIGWSMAEVLARFATPETEEALLEATRGMTVRQARLALRERTGGDGQVEEARYGTLDVRVDLQEAWALEATRPMIELLDGRGEPGAWMESLLAEAQCALSNVAPDAELAPEDVAQRQAAWLASIAAGEERMDRREALAESRLPELPAGPAAPSIEPAPRAALAIDRRLMGELAPQLASTDVRFGQLLARFFRARAWRMLGFASEKQYARERLGMSRSAVLARITLARRTAHLAPIGDALRDRRIGYEAAALIARVATPDTAEAWVERAQVRTWKHLREEVSAVELVGRMMRSDEPSGPPSSEEVAIVQALERDMKCGAYARRAFGIAREDDAPGRVDAAIAAAPTNAYAEMARSALVAQEALREMISVARTGSTLTAEEAEAACTGFTPPEGALPTIDLEGDAVRSTGRAADIGGDEPAGSAELVQMSGSSEQAAERMSTEGTATEGTAEEPVQMSVEPSPRRWGKVNLRIRVREETIFHYRMLKAAYERAGVGGSFVYFMVLAFWSSWAEVLGRTNACEAILRRDGYECTCPVCGRSSAAGSHHIRYRSRGGGDEASNQTSPCEWCHLDGVHGGRLQVSGEAPDLVWLIGRTPIMEVRGRERVLLAA